MSIKWTDIKKGDRIRISNNRVLKTCYGIEEAVGTVFMMYPDGGFALKCETTKAMERIMFEDGTVARITE